MTVYIDSSSLISFVRYYLPFDKEGHLLRFLQGKMEDGEIVVLNQIHEECVRMAKGVVIQKLPFLDGVKRSFDTDVAILSLPKQKEFQHHLSNTFVEQSVRSQLKDQEFLQFRESFLKGADLSLIVAGMSDTENSLIVSEETQSSNDMKAFKKIPTLCKTVNLKSCTLPDLLSTYEDISCSITPAS